MRLGTEWSSCYPKLDDCCDPIDTMTFPRSDARESRRAMPRRIFVAGFARIRSSEVSCLKSCHSSQLVFVRYFRERILRGVAPRGPGILRPVTINIPSRASPQGIGVGRISRSCHTRKREKARADEITRRYGPPVSGRCCAAILFNAPSPRFRSDPLAIPPPRDGIAATADDGGD
jgi:hypothetical protein